VLCFPVAPAPNNPSSGGANVYVYSNIPADSAVVWNLPARSPADTQIFSTKTTDDLVIQTIVGNSFLQTTAITNLAVTLNSDTSISLDLTPRSQLSSLLVSDVRSSQGSSGCGNSVVTKLVVPNNLDLMFINIPSLVFSATTLNAARAIVLAGDCLTAQTDYSFQEEITLSTNSIMLSGPVTPRAPSEYFRALATSFAISADAGLFNLYTNSTRALTVTVSQLNVTAVSDLTPRFINVSNALNISHPTSSIETAVIGANSLLVQGITFEFLSATPQIVLSPPADRISVSCDNWNGYSFSKYTIISPSVPNFNFVSTQKTFSVSASVPPPSFSLHSSCFSNLELSVHESSISSLEPTRSVVLGANSVIVSDISTGQAVSGLDFEPSSVASLTLKLASGHTHVSGTDSSSSPPAPYTIIVGSTAQATLDVNTLVPLTLPMQFAESSRRLLHLSASASASAFGLGDCSDRAWFANKWQGALPHYCNTQTKSIHIQVQGDMISLCHQTDASSSLSLVVQPSSMIDSFPVFDAVPSEENVYNTMLGLLAACISIQIFAVFFKFWLSRKAAYTPFSGMLLGSWLAPWIVAASFSHASISSNWDVLICAALQRCYSFFFPIASSPCSSIEELSIIFYATSFFELLAVFYVLIFDTSNGFTRSFKYFPFAFLTLFTDFCIPAAMHFLSDPSTTYRIIFAVYFPFVLLGSWIATYPQHFASCFEIFRRRHSVKLKRIFTLLRNIIESYHRSIFNEMIVERLNLFINPLVFLYSGNS
jgi:hypothetical protein